MEVNAMSHPFLVRAVALVVSLLPVAAGAQEAPSRMELRRRMATGVQTRDWQDVIAAAQALIEADGDDPRVLMMLGRAQLGDGQRDASRENFEAVAATTGPATSFAVARLGILSYEDGDHATAERWLRRSVELGITPMGMKATGPVPDALLKDRRYGFLAEAFALLDAVDERVTVFTGTTTGRSARWFLW